MSETEPSHLSNINTCWTVLRRAHTDADSAVAAREQLLRMYGNAVRRYLVVLVKDAHTADDLAQEFALSLLRGDFHKANPQAGRFRNYVKSALFHLVAAHRKKQNRMPEALAPDSPTMEALAVTQENADQAFHETWRNDLLSRVWKALATQKPEFHTVLRFRATNDRLTSQQMAEQLSAILGKPMNAASVRQTLRRARVEFVRLLRADVAESVEADEIDDELRDLGLLEYCQGGKE